ncbi:uncharacterized protein METZ01_LOCUS450788 [marine metagenome]|uniref:Uncharacterized protein n=1 Tax=marine metagenome TaxID=408172 RepID=A0A382ZR15_9ZZZZ
MPTTTALLLAKMPEETNGIPPLIVAGSMLTPKTFEKFLMSSSSASG